MSFCKGSLELGAFYPLFVFPKLHTPQLLPRENNALGAEHCQLAGNEARIPKFRLRNLPFARAGPQISPPRYRATWHVIVTGNFDSLEMFPSLLNTNYLIEMARIVSDPFTCQIR